jgi:hypothetical protein
MTKRHCKTVYLRIFPSPRMGEDQGGGDEGRGRLRMFTN